MICSGGQLTASVTYGGIALGSTCDLQRNTSEEVRPAAYLAFEPDPIALLTDARRHLIDAHEQLQAAVIRARQHHATWTAIASVLGTTRQAAQQRFTGLDIYRSIVCQTPAHEPPEVISHNDFAPCNMVFDGRRRLVGVIDGDTASPGPRIWDLDLAYLACRLVPLTAPTNVDGNGFTMSEHRRRLELVCDSYRSDQIPMAMAEAAVERLTDLAAFPRVVQAPVLSTSQLTSSCTRTMPLGSPTIWRAPAAARHRPVSER